MTTTVPAFRAVRMIAVASLLTFASLSGLYIFNAAIQLPLADGPVEEWIRIGIEMHRLDEQMPKMNHDTEHQQLISKAEKIVWDSEFPGTSDAYIAYKERRVENVTWPAAFWLALASSLIGFISAFSWLHGVSHATASVCEKAEQSIEPALPAPVV